MMAIGLPRGIPEAENASTGSVKNQVSRPLMILISTAR